jgi:anti-sigma factor RsiW
MDKISSFETRRRLWRQAAPALRGALGAPLDPLMIAAYAEGRLASADAAMVERHLATDPAALDLLIALTQPIDAPANLPANLIARASALVPVPVDAATDRIIVQFHDRRRRAVRAYAAWAAMAASLLLVSTIGFHLGSMAEQSIDPARHEISGDLTDPSASLMSSDVLG